MLDIIVALAVFQGRSKTLVKFFITLFIGISSITYGQLNPPYPAYWINPFRVLVNGSTLYKNSGPNAWGAGAISSNLLQPNTDGWIEFAGATGAHYILGLASDNKLDIDKFSHAFYLDQAANFYAIYEGSTIISMGSWQAGDIFKISRDAGVVNYFRNGANVRTVTVNPAVLLHIKATIRYSGKSTSPVTASFDGRLIVEASVRATDETTGAGNISVQASGGEGPYVYSWSSGEQTSTINGKPVGDYTVTVSDAVGHLQERTFQVGHKLNWVNTTGVAVSGSIITKTQSISTWANGGITSTVLPPNTDGWLEFTASENSHYMIGFAVNDLLDTDKFNHAILIDYDNNRYRIHEGTNVTALTPWQTGDVFRISRVGNIVNYYRNESIIRTVTVNPALVLKVKAVLQYAGKRTPYLNTSIRGQMFLLGTVTGMAGNSGAGNITFNAIGSTTPYMYTWSSGEQTASIDSKQRGAYIVTVNDAFGDQKTRTYNVGYKVNWTNQIGVTRSNGVLTKNINGNVWDNAGAISSNTLTANTDGWVEFSVHDGDYIIGLAVNNTIDIDEFSHAVRVDHLTNTYTIYSGGSAVSGGSWQTGDVFRISRENSIVNYYKNDQVVTSVSANPGLVLKLKAAIRYRYVSTPVINTSFWTSDGVVRTYYSISDGNWTTPSTWSLAENGPPSTVYPYDIDRVVIKGNEVIVNSTVAIGGITITASVDGTKLSVDSNMGKLTVRGSISMNRDGQANNNAEVLQVQNNGSLDVR